jgi:hypothetical protein
MQTNLCEARVITAFLVKRELGTLEACATTGHQIRIKDLCDSCLHSRCLPPIGIVNNYRI